jgi:hypothetical protein
MRLFCLGQRSAMGMRSFAKENLGGYPATTLDA